jgi:hypothetical protein
VTRRLRTFDVRVWVVADDRDAWRAAYAFMRAARWMALAHPDVSVRWVCERKNRDGSPRIRRGTQDFAERVDLGPLDVDEDELW